MGDNFFVYLERLELMIFFSGYPLIYMLVHVLADTGWAKKLLKKDITGVLPYAYALVGVLYLGLQLKNLYPDYSFEHISIAAESPLLKIWGLLALLFFLPFFAQKPFYSLMHSLVFFFFLLRDLWLNIFQKSDGTALKNDMNIYTYSLLINLAAFIVVILVYLLIRPKPGQKINARD